ncbi:replication-associated recombination protein A [Candidatus Dojkabacteria bacterium]|uniref:Replication-associated recombination protein A n=1 Tax=Candidatus Dojkabacteria bacterium TaxID=2099670 RepID=A0A955IF85_9BACT|nr:replication-associated recombination protein A [Candidatus Dojkabacteria bacterium]
MDLLANTLRPKNLDEFIGQQHLVGKNGPLRKLLESGNITSMILWGPPGCGKTTFARLIPNYVDAHFEPFSAVTGGIADVRKIIKIAEDRKIEMGKETILFVDEIHRFNKAQQDAFLPHVENGTIILVGATTENPGFEVNAPLISRSRVFKFEHLGDDEILIIIDKALKQNKKVTWTDDAKQFLVGYSDGDARKVLNAIEFANKNNKTVDLDTIQNVLQQKLGIYDKKGDAHYDTISAFIKSMRGSKPDATLHYLARMMEAGEDPIFIARRMVIFASEDIGNAKPTALVVATSTMNAVNMIGMPEASLILAQCATYLASCPKSIAVTEGIMKARADVRNKPLNSIPLHLRNAANKVMKNFGYAKGHTRYPWLEERNGKKINQEYMPKNLIGAKYYDIKNLSESL